MDLDEIFNAMIGLILLWGMLIGAAVVGVIWLLVWLFT